MADFKYRAFISYSHADHDWGVWLHKKLERFRTPKQLVGRETAIGEVPRRLGRVYRDEAEEGAAHDLGERIERALTSSDALIVVCSPASAKSKWVNQEIIRFKQLGREHRVYPILVDGEPHADDPAEECFPDALNYRLGPDGKLSNDPADPLAVDIRKFGRDDTVLRLASGILDIDYDDLKQRDVIRQRRERRRAQGVFVAGLVLVLAALVGGVGVYLLSNEVSERTSQLFATTAEELNNQGDHAKATLVALAAAPSGEGGAGFDSTEARVQLDRAYIDDRLRLVFRSQNYLFDRASFSPDGARIVTVSKYNEAQVRDIKTGQRIGASMRHRDKIHAAVFSADGTRIVTASKDRSARLWNAETGEPSGAPLLHDSDVRIAKFSPDGTRVLTASFSSTARLWNAMTGAPIIELIGAVFSADFSPDGTRIVTHNRDGTAQLWNGLTGDQITVLHERWGETGWINQDYVKSAEFSPDGSRILTVDVSRRPARLWNGETGEPIGEPMDHNNFRVRSATFSPNGTRIVTVSQDGSALLWNGATGAPIGEPMRHRSDVKRVKFSPNGTQIFTAADNGSVQVWDGETGAPIGNDIGQDLLQFPIAYSPNGRTVVTAASNRTMQLRSAKTGTPLGKLMFGAAGGVVFSPDGSYIVTNACDENNNDCNENARLWDVETLEPLRHNDLIRSATFSTDGTRVVTASNDNTARLWDAETGASIAVLQHESRVKNAAFSPDGTTILTVAYDEIVRLWDGISGEPLRALSGHDGRVNAAAFSPDGARIVTASSDDTAQVWSAKTGAPINEPLHHKSDVDISAFSPDGTRIITASTDRTVRLWDAETGAPIGEPLRHNKRISSAAFSPDGTRILTVSNDGIARLWNSETGVLLHAWEHLGAINSAAFSPDGAYVITASGRGGFLLEGDIILYNTETGQITARVYGVTARAVAFSPDGSRIVTAAGSKNAAQLWSAETGVSIGEPWRPGGEINSAIFSPDGERILTVSGNSVQFWRVPEYLQESGDQRIRLACNRVQDWSLDEVTLNDRNRYPSLQLAPDHPCDQVGVMSAKWWAEKF